MLTKSGTQLQKYSFKLQGERPIPLLKEKIEELRSTNPTHPLLSVKGYELVSLPEKRDSSDFINEFLTNTADPKKVYIMISEFDKTLYHTEDRLEMTGKCSVQDHPVKGTRKWETLYVVYEKQPVLGQDNQPLIAFDGTILSHDIQIATSPTKTEALALAKTHAIDNDVEVNIVIEKRLTNSKAIVSTLAPQKKTVRYSTSTKTNEFIFFGIGELNL